MKIDWRVILFGIISLAIGYWLNSIANERNNKKLIAALKAELEEINQNKTRVSEPQDIARIELQQAKLEAEISCLESQLKWGI